MWPVSCSTDLRTSVRSRKREATAASLSQAGTQRRLVNLKTEGPQLACVHRIMPQAQQPCCRVRVSLATLSASHATQIGGSSPSSTSY